MLDIYWTIQIWLKGDIFLVGIEPVDPRAGGHNLHQKVTREHRTGSIWKYSQNQLQDLLELGKHTFIFSL
jgi:hypothetical protein